ncbi:MAG: 16S rRNA (guanine(966)-N(2))-methyltransferase RsmD [Pseudomonadota bacterium]|nr:16S rRNA (guanine(966)-N(2))-methyltransferase RsmD [Pseudomonadota bacterium]
MVDVRIIGGSFRGRKIPLAKNTALRPSMSRIRETAFNWLAPTIWNASCLDAFAGTGVLGFEAISRGAASVHLIEQHSATAAQLKKTASLLGCESQVTVQQGDALRLIQRISEPSFDLVFLDPPFNQGLLINVIDGLLKSGCLKPKAQLYIEAEKSLVFSDVLKLDHWQQRKYKAAGDMHYALYQLSH